MIKEIIVMLHEYKNTYTTEKGVYLNIFKSVDIYIFNQVQVLEGLRLLIH